MVIIRFPWEKYVLILNKFEIQFSFIRLKLKSSSYLWKLENVFQIILNLLSIFFLPLQRDLLYATTLHYDPPQDCLCKLRRDIYFPNFYQKSNPLFSRKTLYIKKSFEVIFVSRFIIYLLFLRNYLWTFYSKLLRNNSSSHLKTSSLFSIMLFAEAEEVFTKTEWIFWKRRQENKVLLKNIRFVDFSLKVKLFWVL